MHSVWLTPLRSAASIDVYVVTASPHTDQCILMLSDPPEYLGRNNAKIVALKMQKNATAAVLFFSKLRN